MFRTVLVPLDGSTLAEQALTPACRIAEKFGSALLLLRVVSLERSLPSLPLLAPRGEAEAGAAPRPVMDEAEAYLTGLSLPVPIRSVRTQVLAGAPPELIVATAASSEVDLIVMSTHGRTGLVRLLYGSVAEAVLRGASVPVLLVPSRAVTQRVEAAHAAGPRVTHQPTGGAA
jgi:nucleotide-binding universal stress UspA family protein